MLQEVIDKLTEMHNLQRQLQKIVEKNNRNSYFYKDNDRFLGSKLFDICYNLISEIVELQNETDWKYWKQPRQELNLAKVNDEIADIDHFVTQICLQVGITPEQRYLNYLKKNKANRERQNNGY